MSWKSFINAMASTSRTPLGQEPHRDGVDEMAKLRVELAKRTGQRDSALAAQAIQAEQIRRHLTHIETLTQAVRDWQEQLAEAEATISGLGLENADLRRAIVDADNTAARTVNP